MTKRRRSITQPSAKIAAPVAPSQRSLSWDQRLREPVDVAGLAFFRIAFGVILLWEVIVYFWMDWIGDLYVLPQFHFTFYGFEWVCPWPGAGMYWHFFALGVLAAGIALGLCYRWAMGAFCAGFTYVFLLERAHYLNHFYLICLLSFVMIFIPAHRAWSLDARRDRALRSDFVPAWALWIVRLQIAIPYFYGSLAKLNGDWLHGQPMQLWMSRMLLIRTLVPWFGEYWLAVAFAWGGMLLDLLIVPALLWRRTRVAAVCVVVMFHLMNAAMFNIGIFPWLMIAATTLFLPSDWPRKLLRMSPPNPLPAARRPWTPSERRWAIVLAVFFATQLVFPFRHLLYPGNVDWTAEGEQFAWRMMLNDKPCAAQFLFVDPQARKVVAAADPRQVLRTKQLEKLSGDPENIRQFAVFLKEGLQAQGQEQIEVRVVCLCSLNGRKPQLLIDPTVDLGAQGASLWHQPWIVPLQEPLRHPPWNMSPSEWPKYVELPRVP